MFHDAEYVAWANESTIHAMSYSLDKDEPKPEPLVEVTRDGEKIETLAMYPMLTSAEAETLVNEINRAVLFPTSTPWSGVISPVDGSTILAEMKKGTAKEFRALYEAEQKKLGPVVPRPLWKKVVAAVSASTEAEFDEKFADAVRLALEARSLVKDPPKTLAERITARVDALEKVGRDRLGEALALKDGSKRTAAVGAVAVAFKGLPVGDAAAAASSAK